MDRDKLVNYELTASIHTVEIHSNRRPLHGVLGEEVIKVTCKPGRKTGKLISRSIINPHEYGYGEITNYSLYEEAMSEITEEVGLRNYEYSRVDIRLDCFEDNYLEYVKLNGLLLGLFSIAYKVINDDVTVNSGLRKRFVHGVYLKNQSMGIEYYDKKKQSQNKFPCKARLEFRAFKLKGKCPVDVMNTWNRRLGRLERYYDKFLDECNEDLYRYYEYWLKKNQLDNSAKSTLRCFIRENQGIVFTTKQLERFCLMCGWNEGRGKRIHDTLHIEMISQSDIRRYISKIKKEIARYMET